MKSSFWCLRWYEISESTNSTIEVKLHILKSAQNRRAGLQWPYRLSLDGNVIHELFIAKTGHNKGCTGTVERQNTTFGRIKMHNVQIANEQSLSGEHSATMEHHWSSGFVALSATAHALELHRSFDAEKHSPLDNELPKVSQSQFNRPHTTIPDSGECQMRPCHSDILTASFTCAEYVVRVTCWSCLGKIGTCTFGSKSYLFLDKGPGNKNAE